jgi:hypothetical protein
LHPGNLESPYYLGFFDIFHTIAFSATIKMKPAVAFWQAFSADLLIFAKVIVCEMGNRAKDG